MSRRGNCWDNAVAESFFHTIKTQMIHHCRFQNVAEAEQAIFNYIKVYYNRQRKHSTNGYKSTVQYELEWWDNSVAESFFGSLKTERVFDSNYFSREEAKRDIVDYVEMFYNSRRRHSYLGYFSPIEFEKRMALKKAA